MASNIDLVNQQGDIVAKDLAALNAAKSDYQTKLAASQELYRQLQFHQGVPGISSHPGVLDQANANLVNTQYVAAQTLTDKAKSTMDAAQATLDADTKTFTNMKDSLLSASEKQAVDLAQQQKNLAAQTQLDQQKSSILMQKTTKYFIIGGIILAVVVIVLVVVRKKYKAEK